MAQTKFSAGQRVSIARGGIGSPAGMFNVLMALPRDAGPQQYRVRGDTETFDRVVDEASLQAVPHE